MENLPFKIGFSERAIANLKDSPALAPIYLVAKGSMRKDY